MAGCGCVRSAPAVGLSVFVPANGHCAEQSSEPPNTITRYPATPATLTIHCSAKPHRLFSMCHPPESVAACHVLGLPRAHKSGHASLLPPLIPHTLLPTRLPSYTHPRFLLFLPPPFSFFTLSYLNKVHGWALVFSYSPVLQHAPTPFSSKLCVSLSTPLSSSSPLRRILSQVLSTPRRIIKLNRPCSSVPPTGFTSPPSVTAPVWRGTFESRSEA